VMRAAGPGAYGDRLRAVIVVLWRAGLRIGEALALAETDLDPARGAVLIRCGKGGLCRIRHRPPYVAPGTMLRSRPYGRRVTRLLPVRGT
jgi:integrase